MMALSVIRAHWRDMLATLTSLTLGIAVSSAALLAFTSARPAVPPDYAHAPTLVQAPYGGTDSTDVTKHRPWSEATTQELSQRLAAQPGIDQAVPIRSFYAQLVLDGTPAGDVSTTAPEGRSWSMTSLAPYGLEQGRAPSRDDEIAVSDEYDVRVGQRLPMLTVHGQQRATVVGLVRGPGIYLPDRQAARLDGGTALIGVTGTSGTPSAAVARAASAVTPAGSTVLTGDRRSAAESTDSTQTRYLGGQLLTLMLALTCCATVFVVSQTLALATAHRRRDIALLRAAGATPGQIRSMLMREAAVLGLIGAALGAGLGTLLAPLLGRLLVRTGLQPVGFSVQISPVLVVGVVAGPLLAVAATWTSARHASTISPLEALRFAEPGRRRPNRWRIAIGGLTAIGAVGSVVAATTAEPEAISGWASVATVLVVAALTALGPIVLPPLIRVLTWPLTRTRGATGLVVRGSMTTATDRTTSTMAPVLATVALATLVLGYVDTGRSAFGGEGVPASASAVVAPDATPGLTEATVHRTLAKVGTGADVDLTSEAFVASGGPAATVEVVGSSTIPAGSAVVSQQAAREHGWVVGRPASLVLADGTTVTARVARVLAQEDGTVGLNRALVRAHDSTAMTPRIVLDEAGVDRVADLARPGVRVLSVDDYASASTAEEYRLLRLFVLVALALAAGYTLLSVANTQLMAAAGRVRDLGLLRLSGASPEQARTALFAEAMLTVVLGSLFGLVAGLVGVLGVRGSLARQMDTEVALSVPWGWLVVLVVGSAVLAGAAGVWPSWRMLRRPPAGMARPAG